MNLGNVPCSWSVEFAYDPRDPPWQAVFDKCAFARFAGIELALVSFLPEDPPILLDAPASCDLAGGGF
jgi:sugar phosphate isomerase/epimerase